MQTGNFRGFEVTLEPPGIALVTLNQPDRLNGMTQGLKRDLIEILSQAQMDDAVRVVVLTGSGRAFSAGDDITGRPLGGTGATALMPDIGTGHDTPIGTYEGLRVLSQTLNTAVRQLDKITIAAVNGVAIQTGMSLALSCDFRIASTEARIGSGTLRFGLMPDEGGHWLIVQMLGLPRALDFFMRNRIVSGEEALALGLVHDVAEPDRLMTRATELAREFAAGPQIAIRLLKRSLYNAAEQTWAHALDDIAAKTAVSDHHEDAREGVTAFREKRAPTFS
ncbi:MAG TPA: enoyl-CoA hydratase/isomerase family protein [Dehalococcoidia bacterium]|nr:enoyl-CoA hydratase/isomerase family protein [Dehalococcoidia bacterium]